METFSALVVRGIHRSPVNSPHKGQWRRALLFSLICFWINGWVNNGEAGDLRRHRAHYDVTLMYHHFVSHDHDVMMYDRYNIQAQNYHLRDNSLYILYIYGIRCPTPTLSTITVFTEVISRLEYGGSYLVMTPLWLYLQAILEKEIKCSRWKAGPEFGKCTRRWKRRKNSNYMLLSH